MSRLVAGIGFRHAATAEEIADLIRRALALGGFPADRLGAIATAADRAGAPQARDAASAFGLAILPVAEQALAAADTNVETRSARIEASRGIGSVAEAAALAAAGAGSRLVLPRIASAGATCALAEHASGTDEPA